MNYNVKKLTFYAFTGAIMKIHLMATDSRHSANFVLSREHGTNDYLFILFKSPAMLWVEGKYVSVDYGSCVLFDKHSKQSYFPVSGEEFLHDFMHLDCESEEERALIGSVPKSVALPLLLPSRLTECMATIEKELRFDSPYQSQIISALCASFLYIVKSETKKNNLSFAKHKYYEQLYSIRTEIYQNPSRDWSIDSILKTVFISRSYLQHAYKEFFGRSCMEDVILARINYAKTLLINEGLSISEIAEACGYNCTEHFIRQFAKNVGATPHQYRKNQTKIGAE